MAHVWRSEDNLSGSWLFPSTRWVLVTELRSSQMAPSTLLAKPSHWPMEGPFYSGKCFPCRIKHLVKPVVTESVKWTCCLCVVMTVSVKDKAAIQQYVANKETCTVKEISTRYGRPDRDIGGQL